MENRMMTGFIRYPHALTYVCHEAYHPWDGGAADVKHMLLQAYLAAAAPGVFCGNPIPWEAPVGVNHGLSVMKGSQ